MDECLQQGSCGAKILVEFSPAQGSSVECSTEQRQVSNQFSHRTSDTRPYGINEKESMCEECVVPVPENIEDEIKLLWSPNVKDTLQTEEEGAENAFLRNYQLKRK